MKKESIIGLILGLDRGKKEYLYKNLDNIQSIIAREDGIEKVASTGGFLDLLASLDRSALDTEIEAYNYNPKYYIAEGNLNNIIDLVEDMFRSIAELPEFEEQYDAIIDYADAITLSDESVVAFIEEYSSKFIGAAETPAIAEEDNPIDDIEPETSPIQLEGEIVTKSDGTAYKTVDGIFPVPVDKNGNSILQNVELLRYAQKLMDEAANAGVTAEVSDQKFESEMEEYITTNLDYGSLGGSSDVLVNSMGDFQRKMQDAFPLLTIQNIEDGILQRMGGQSFQEVVEQLGPDGAREAYSNVIRSLASSDNPQDMQLYSSIQSIRFYDDLLRDFAGYQKKKSLNNAVDQAQYDAIMNFARNAYGADFLDSFDGSPYELYQVAADIRTGRGQYSGEMIRSYQNALSLFDGDSESFESILQDLFGRIAIKYYKAAGDVSKYYGIQQELLRAKGNNPNLVKFCSRCGRFRQTDYSRTLLEKDTSQYYVSEPDNRRRYNIEHHPDAAFEEQQLALLSDEATALLNTPCEKTNCNVDEYFVDNYFVPADETFDKYSFYYGYRPLTIDGEEIPIPLSERDSLEETPSVLSDRFYQEYIGSTLDRLSQSSGMSRDEIKKAIINFIQYNAAILPPKSSDGKTLTALRGVNDEEYFDPSSEEGSVGLAAADQLMELLSTNLTEAQVASIEKLTEMNPNVNRDDAVKLFAAKELWRLMPHDYPSGNLTDDVLGHQNVSMPQLNWPASGMSHFYGLSNDLNQFTHISSSAKFLKIQQKVNALALRLAEEMIAAEGENGILTGDRDALMQECRTRLGAKELTVPIPVDPLKSGKKYKEEQIAAVREKLLAISFADNIDSLPPSYVQGVDYVGYGIDPEEVADKVKQLLEQYSTRLRNVLPVDFDATLEGNKNKKRLTDFLSANPMAKKVVSYTNAFFFREAMEKAIASPMSADQVNEAYQKRYEIEYNSIFPLEDQAILIMVDTLGKDRPNVDPTIIKVSMRDEFAKIHMDFVSGGEPELVPDEQGNLVPEIKPKSGQVFSVMAMALNSSLNEESVEGSSSASFIKNILTDPSIAKQSRFSKYNVSRVVEDPVNFYSPTKGAPGTSSNIVSYTDAVDVFSKFLNSDDDVGVAVLDDVNGNNTLLDPQARQLLGAIDLSRKAKKSQNYTSTREALYMAANMVRWGTVPERMRTFNYMGWTNSGIRSMMSAIFGRYGINWMAETPLQEFLEVPGGMKTRVTKKSGENSWYKKAQVKEEQTFDDTPRYVFVYSDGDAQHLIDSSILASKKATPKRLMMPKMTLIPFEKFGSVFAAVQKFSGTDMNPIFVTDADLELLRGVM